MGLITQKEEEEEKEDVLEDCARWNLWDGE
jgi:hypothetical protein